MTLWIFLGTLVGALGGYVFPRVEQIINRLQSELRIGNRESGKGALAQHGPFNSQFSIPNSKLGYFAPATSTSCILTVGMIMPGSSR